VAARADVVEDVLGAAGGEEDTRYAGEIVPAGRTKWYLTLCGSEEFKAFLLDLNTHEYVDWLRNKSGGLSISSERLIIPGLIFSSELVEQSCQSLTIKTYR
jgi:hypothetical protein